MQIGMLLKMTVNAGSVSPVADLIAESLKRTPSKGTISGPDLLMLQGLVNLLRNPSALIAQTENLTESSDLAKTLAMLGSFAEQEEPGMRNDPLPVFSPAGSQPQLASYGLW